MPTRSLVLPGTLAALEPLGEFVHAAAREAGFDRHAAYRLHLAVDEVATNTVTHGYEERGIKGELYLSAEIDPAALRIHLEDTGAPYDPTQRADPKDLDKPLEERGVGGLGIFLAKRNVDAFLYERRGDRNRVTFVLHRGASRSG
jgi:anti-sigma regulatory factor (Ser/Thr protein kinase)